LSSPSQRSATQPNAIPERHSKKDGLKAAPLVCAVAARYFEVHCTPALTVREFVALEVAVGSARRSRD
jgi:hypothetical protein